jgi:hypothetical protein
MTGYGPLVATKHQIRGISFLLGLCFARSALGAPAPERLKQRDDDEDDQQKQLLD